MSTVISTPAAATDAVVKMVKSQMTTEARVYPAYIRLHKVTVETVAEHVKALTGVAYPGVKANKRADSKSDEYKAGTFANKVRNGLNRNLAVEETEDEVKAPTLRVSLSGKGGATAEVDMSTDLGKALLAFLEGSKN